MGVESNFSGLFFFRTSLLFGYTHKKSSSFYLFVPIISMVSTIDPLWHRENYSHAHRAQRCFGGGWSSRSKI